MRKLLLAIVLIPFVIGDAATAALDIVITDGIKRRPIAIVPFGWEGNTPAMPSDVAEIISNDLNRSGRFAPLPLSG